MRPIFKIIPISEISKSDNRKLTLGFESKAAILSDVILFTKKKAVKVPTLSPAEICLVWDHKVLSVLVAGSKTLSFCSHAMIAATCFGSLGYMIASSGPQSGSARRSSDGLG
jgi:hypothetical protein